MDNERVAIRWLPTKKPGVAVWATVQFSPFWHTTGSKTLPADHLGEAARAFSGRAAFDKIPKLTPR